jgi:hypothetical protein
MPSMTTFLPLVRAALVAAVLSGAGFTHASATATETLKRIETLTGLKGTYIESEGVFKVTQPRTDVAVRVDRWPLQPFVGLSTWVAFTRGGRFETMLMGDIVVFEDEINPVMSVLLDGGVAVTALHNHFLYDDPKVYFMHIGGEGTVESLAPTIRGALATIAAIRAERPRPALDSGIEPPPPVSAISGGRISAVLRTPGQAKDGMYKVVIGREVTMECGCTAAKEMGVNTWAGFAGTDDDALVDGDFAVRESELQAVLKALRGGGINIVSIHHHMVGETPRTLFLHYWGRGRAEALAGALRAALDAQGLP